VSEASCAWKSPQVISGLRTFWRMSARASSLSAPPLKSLIGGMRMPSWKISVALAA
jgi:hypothetical protein